MRLLLQNHFYSFLCYLAKTQSKEEDLVKNAVFLLFAGRYHRVKESYQFVSSWPFST